MSLQVKDYIILITSPPSARYSPLLTNDLAQQTTFDSVSAMIFPLTEDGSAGPRSVKPPPSPSPSQAPLTWPQSPSSTIRTIYSYLAWVHTVSFGCCLKKMWAFTQFAVHHCGIRSGVTIHEKQITHLQASCCLILRNHSRSLHKQFIPFQLSFWRGKKGFAQL